MTLWKWASLLLAMLVAQPALARPAPAAVAAPAPFKLTPWLSHVTVTPAGGVVLGNPDAKIHLVEYMSYICPHCAAFEAEGVPRLRLTVVAQGKATLEVRHFLLGPVDLTVAMLTHCVPPSQFFALHSAFLNRQPEWKALWGRLNGAQLERWQTGDDAGRMRNMASDLHFYEIMAGHGLSRIEVDRCFANTARMRQISAQTADAKRNGIDSTPTFLIGNDVLIGTYDWPTLEAQLNARM